MTNEFICWLSGYFEGEGTFAFHKDVAKAITISSTDFDVLERIHKEVGGSLCKLKRRKKHWKDAWKWTLYHKPAIELAKSMLPNLFERRAEVAKRWIAEYESRINKAELKKLTYVEKAKAMYELSEKGMTHQAIAEIYKHERSHVTRLVKKVKSGEIK